MSKDLHLENISRSKSVCSRLIVIGMLNILFICAEADPGLFNAPSAHHCDQFFNRKTGALDKCPGGQSFDFIRLVCRPENQAVCAINVTETLIPMCCDRGEVFDITKNACQLTNFSWTPVFHQWTGDKSSDKAIAPDVNHKLLYGVPCLNDSEPSLEDDFSLMHDGALHVPQLHALYRPQIYCLVHVSQANKTIAKAALCNYRSNDEYIESTARRDGLVPVAVCCRPGEILHGSSCVPIDDPENLVVPLESYFAGLSNSSHIPSYRIFYAKWRNLSCSYREYLADEDPFYINDDGNAVFFNRNETLDALSYCLFWERPTDSSFHYNMFIHRCVLDDNKVHPNPIESAVQKCCPPSHSLQIVNFQVHRHCIQDSRNNESLHRFLSEVSDNPNVFHFQYGFPDNLNLIFSSAAIRSISNDGRVKFKTSSGESQMSKYCIDATNGSDVRIFISSFKEETPYIVGTLYPILIGVDLVFLVTILVVYLLVPDPCMSSLNKRRRISQTMMGKILISYIVSMTLGYILLLCAYIFTNNETMCHIVAVLKHFFQLALFFWMSALSFEVYRGTRQTTRLAGLKRFRYYAVYAWLGPAVMTVLAVAIDSVTDAPDLLIQPLFGVRSCGISSRLASALYLYTPLMIMWLACLILYLMTVKHLCGSNFLTKHNSNRSENKHIRERRILCLKLFVIMGIFWILEAISFFSGWSPVSIFIDIIIFVQPMFIFFAFVIRPHVVSYIKQSASSYISGSNEPSCSTISTGEKAKINENSA